MNKKIPLIETLSKESKALYDAVNGEDDLPCVLISTSFLDQCLASLLERSFIKGSTARRLLDPRGGPLGNISARADICYCFDLIPKELYQNLRTVTEIRNRFAHSYLSLSFGDSEITRLCKTLTFPKATAKRVEVVTGESYNIEDPFARFNTPRDRFAISVVLMANRLLLIGLAVGKDQDK